MSSTAKDEIDIRARQSQLDPDLCTFMVDRTVHQGGPYRFNDDEDAKGSPLPQLLFATGGVASVVIQNDSVIVRKKPDGEWSELMPAIGKSIREQVSGGAPVILKEREAFAPPRDDAEIQARVQKILDDEINPGLGHHGGSVSIDKVKDRVVYVRMEGGCQGCASASMTMHQGVEVMLRRAIPSIDAVVDATDHSAGDRPFY